MAYEVLANNVQWGDSPEIYFQFQASSYRWGGKQAYDILVWCQPLTGTKYFGYPIYVEVSLDGVQRARYTLKNASPSRWDSIIKGYTPELYCDNKVSGTTALSIRIYSGMGSTRNQTYNYTLPVVSAASAISCTTAHIESNPTITIDSISPSFTHSVSYKFGSLSGDIAVKTSATSITSWTIPEEFYSQIPNNKNGEGTLTCTTYNGNDILGTSQCKLPVTTDKTKCAPTVSGTVVDINPKTVALTGNELNLVRYHSTALCTINTTLNKGAGSILEQNINGIDVPYPDTELTFENTDNLNFWFTAIDSRGWDASVEVRPLLIPYIKLTANLTGQRTDPTSGNARITVRGNFFADTFGLTDNHLSVKCQQADGSYIDVTPKIDTEKNEYSVTVPLSGLTYTKAFDISVIVEDELETVTKTINIPKGVPVFDWGEEDFNFNVPVTIKGVDILEKLAELEERITQLAAKG